jgi:ATP-dependent DNA helicase RecG
MLNFRLASIVDDKDLLFLAHEWSDHILDTDPDLNSTENLPIKNHLQSLKGKTAWSRIS